MNRNLLARRASGLSAVLPAPHFPSELDYGTITLDSGFACPDILPDLAAIAAEALTKHRRESLQYSAKQGQPELRGWIADYMSDEGCTVTPDASPMVAPTIVFAVAIYFLYAPLGLTDTYLGLVLAHTVLATPFVVIVVHAALQGFEITLLRAAASLGDSPRVVALRVLVPLIAPGMAAGAVFAFMTSFDEIVVALFVAGPAHRTLPLQMFEGVREQVSPEIAAAATLLAVTSVILLATLHVLRRRNRRLYRPD